MKAYKLDLEKTIETYHLIDSKIELNNCYSNVFRVAQATENKDFNFCYGYIEQRLTNTTILFRHCFLKDNNTNKIIDVTALLWRDFEEDYNDYNYYIFKEFDKNEYLLEILNDEEGTGVLNSLYKEEAKLLNALLKKGIKPNPVDLKSLIDVVYEGDTIRGFEDFNKYNKIMTEKRGDK